VRNVIVPVFGSHGGVALVLVAYGLPRASTVTDINRYRDALIRAARSIGRERA
jgi:DNA-binding IclR family transcriptional regulator